MKYKISLLFLLIFLLLSNSFAIIIDTTNWKYVIIEITEYKTGFPKVKGKLSPYDTSFYVDGFKVNPSSSAYARILDGNKKSWINLIINAKVQDSSAIIDDFALCPCSEIKVNIIKTNNDTCVLKFNKSDKGFDNFKYYCEADSFEIKIDKIDYKILVNKVNRMGKFSLDNFWKNIRETVQK